MNIFKACLLVGIFGFCMIQCGNAGSFNSSKISLEPGKWIDKWVKSWASFGYIAAEADFVTEFKMTTAILIISPASSSVNNRVSIDPRIQESSLAEFPRQGLE